MSVVTIGEAWPAQGEPFTVAELDRMPDDGRRYELLDGMLAVSPRPVPIHQVVVMRLCAVLDRACPDGLQVVPEPAVQLTTQTEFDPDIVVVPLAQIAATKITEPPLLVVEVRSPSTALIDLNLKKKEYQRFGVQSYWIVGPSLTTPTLTVFHLHNGRYVEVAQVQGDEPFGAEHPYPVEIVPGQLVRGLPGPA